MFSLLLPLIYISFISLGLPDGLLGAAWPSMYPGLGVPVSGAGVLSMIICIGTIASSLSTDRMTRRLGTGKVTALIIPGRLKWLGLLGREPETVIPWERIHRLGADIIFVGEKGATAAKED